jgi:group I intron endonuclease
LIGFLGYDHSPKWSKNNNYKSSTLCEKQVTNLNANLFRPGFNSLNFKNSLGLRHYSSSSSSSSSSSYSSDSSSTSITMTKLKSDDMSSIKDNKVENSKVLIDFLTEKNLNPVYFYEDLHLDSTRKKIQKDTSNLSGIYLILNKVTLDYYIGSAATNRFYARFSNHLLNFRGSKIVKLAVRKYKLSQFAFIILELFPEVVNKHNNKKLLDLEDFYLKYLLPNYNILTEAGSSFGYKHTEISRIKMKANYSQDRRDKIGNLNKGKNLSKETIEKLRTKAITREKPIYSEEALLNMKKKSKTVVLYNLDNTVYGEFSSIVEAAKSLGCSDKTIRRALNTEKKVLKRRWIVKYL